MDALNPRGHRESNLKEALLQERERLQQLLQNCDRSKYRHTGKYTPVCTPVNVEIQYIDNLNYTVKTQTYG